MSSMYVVNGSTIFQNENIWKKYCSYYCFTFSLTYCNFFPYLNTSANKIYTKKKYNKVLFGIIALLGIPRIYSGNSSTVFQNKINWNKNVAQTIPDLFIKPFVIYLSIQTTIETVLGIYHHPLGVKTCFPFNFFVKNLNMTWEVFASNCKGELKQYQNG